MNSNKPLLFIDASYLHFYRYYATITWFKSSKQLVPLPENYNWFENEIFMNKLKKLYLPSILKILKKQKLSIPYENFIFARDCSRKNIWRTKLFPEYKIQRNKLYHSKEWKGGPILNYLSSIYLPELQQKYGFQNIKINGLEADDIIACCVRHIQKTQPNRKLYIITNDHDYLQLINSNTTIYNLQNKNLNNKSCGDPKKDLLLKIIVGDKSDNIPKCFKKCGNKTALKLINNPELLQKKLQENPQSKILFERNTQLIDFSYIPHELQEHVLNFISC
tara:strand:- start:137 stop:967 length:831 start_codon:yes stop_codon:yes gene_type:complete